MQLFFVTFSQVVLAIALPYFLFSLILGIRVAQKRGGLGAQEELRGVGEVDLTTPSGYHVYFLIACLNESLVIGATVRRLLADSACSVVVIDDGSDDGTGDRALEVAAEMGAHDRMIVLERRLPNARQGKGRALNAAYTLVLNDVQFRELDPAKVIVCVMDADGMLSRGGTRVPLQYFDDPSIGGVQLIVRIRNREKLIGQFQDVEFWMISALSQFARSLSGTVSLGGNGQFTRLSALLTLDGDPWSDSLTEDLDLGLQLLAKGWKCTTTTHAFVDQQGVESYRRLLKQRTRWYQGHMSCITRLPQLWKSDQIGQVALAETTTYLLVPWMIVLPWSILQQWVFLELIVGDGNGVFAKDLGSMTARIVYGTIFYVFSFMPNLAIGLAYARRTKAVSLGRALALGHLMILWNYIGYLAAWRGIYRMIRRRSGWDKTARSIEVHQDQPLNSSVQIGELVMISEGANELSFITPGIRTPDTIEASSTIECRAEDRSEVALTVASASGTGRSESVTADRVAPLPAARVIAASSLKAPPMGASLGQTRAPIEAAAAVLPLSPSAKSISVGPTERASTPSSSGPADRVIAGESKREPTPPRTQPAMSVTAGPSVREPTPPRVPPAVQVTAGLGVREPTPPRVPPAVQSTTGVSGRESTPPPAAPVAKSDSGSNSRLAPTLPPLGPFVSPANRQGPPPPPELSTSMARLSPSKISDPASSPRRPLPAVGIPVRALPSPMVQSEGSAQAVVGATNELHYSSPVTSETFLPASPVVASSPRLAPAPPSQPAIPTQAPAVAAVTRGHDSTAKPEDEPAESVEVGRTVERSDRSLAVLLEGVADSAGASAHRDVLEKVDGSDDVGEPGADHADEPAHPEPFVSATSLLLSADPLANVPSAASSSPDDEPRRLKPIDLTAPKDAAAVASNVDQVSEVTDPLEDAEDLIDDVGLLTDEDGSDDSGPIVSATSLLFSNAIVSATIDPSLMKGATTVAEAVVDIAAPIARTMSPWEGSSPEGVATHSSTEQFT